MGDGEKSIFSKLPSLAEVGLASLAGNPVNTFAGPANPQAGIGVLQLRRENAEDCRAGSETGDHEIRKTGSRGLVALRAIQLV